MTIQFYCPNCGAIIAFQDQHIGKRARCLTCGQIFIIPKKDFDTPEKIKPQPENRGDPVPGFYKAVFFDNWKFFFNRSNITTFAFIIVVVFSKFILADAFCCINHITHFLIWGWLLGFYLNIIYETAFDIDYLPQIYIGTSISFVWHALKPLLIFLYTMFIVQIPFITALAILQNKGITYENMWNEHAGSYLLLQILFITGVFLFPIAILTTAIGKDITLLRPDYLFIPVFKAFFPYLIIFAALAAASFIEMHAEQFNSESSLKTNALWLAHNLAVQLVAIFAMRTIGLFRRHYSCYFKW
jgi:hypothetical protein